MQATKKKSQNRSENSGRSASLESALLDFINYRKTKNENEENKHAMDLTKLLFDSYAERMRKFPEHIQTFVKLQMSQIFFNAENPRGPFITITPLPQPQAYSDFPKVNLIHSMSTLRILTVKIKSQAM